MITPDRPIWALFFDVDGTLHQDIDVWLKLTWKVAELAGKLDLADAALAEHRTVFKQFSQDKQKTVAETKLMTIWENLLGRKLHQVELEKILDEMVNDQTFQDGLAAIKEIAHKYPRLTIGILTISFEEIALKIAESANFYYDPISHLMAASRFVYDSEGHVIGFELIGESWYEQTDFSEKLKLELLNMALTELGIPLCHAALVDDRVGSYIQKKGGVVICCGDSPYPLIQGAHLAIRHISDLPAVIADADTAPAAVRSMH